MIVTLYMTRGLPASGKTTWALDHQNTSTRPTKIVCKDDLRAMLDNGVFSKKNESLVHLVQTQIVSEALAAGYDVVVADTNLFDKHEQHWRTVAGRFGAEFILKDHFLEVSVQDCIRRDKQREKTVGKRVITKMAMSAGLLDDGPHYVQQDGSLPNAIICDIDGTLARRSSSRSPFDWERVGEDTIIDPIYDHLMDANSLGKEIILFSGRDERAREATEKWLMDNDVTWHQLHMRPEKDFRPDFIVKKEMFKQHVDGKYYVDYILDDRDQVVKMWREDLKLPCFQVNYGDF